MIRNFCKNNIGNCLFSVNWSISSPVVSCSIVLYTCPSPPRLYLLSSYYYQIFNIDGVAIHVLSICHQDMWKKSIGTYLFNEFQPFFYQILAFFSVFLQFLPWCTLCKTHTTHLYLSHWTCYHTWVASDNGLVCMCCYYHSQLIIPYLAKILGYWVLVESKWCHYVMVEADSYLKCFSHPY